ncbi:MAG: hypothetical protein MUP27_06625 [Desulfobacterales bacterium]|nr:hypothetical protein [Desulfobacterales bacterium]
MKSYRWVTILFLCFFILGCAKARTYSLYLRYQPSRDFPSLQQKIGSTLGIVPFKDERSETLYIGIHTPLQGTSSYFKSDPFPLERAIMNSLTEVLSLQGVKTVPISSWDGRPESLKTMETDSVLMIEIKKFWTEGRAVPFKTNVKMSIHFVIHLGVKKEGKVFTKNVTVEKEMTVFRLAPEKVEQTVNEILAEIFDSFFSDPY